MSSAKFRDLGNEWTVKPELINELEEFTCLMYGYPKIKSVNVLRSFMLRKMVGDNNIFSKTSRIDLSRLPPCRDNLLPHIQRVNYRIAQYKRSQDPIYESPKPYDEDQGWLNTDGTVEPKWSCRDVLPQSLVDLLSTVDPDEVNEEEENEEIEFEDILDDE